MSKSLVDVIAGVAAAGAGGTVGHATAEKIVAAIQAVKPDPSPPAKKLEPVHIKAKEEAYVPPYTPPRRGR